ncbi:hypothetical protein TSAR_001390 [Trichomalopsis sarcophagae]|uniref:Uncharacterized protein n=1 Tax=Trichomalopsis sarcophagae TaxID=543379 RepID=A0A232FBK9_9HYME|nr:hypothetical protein TSAR_001390 [Trichomalopsis sarcophagae]
MCSPPFASSRWCARPVLTFALGSKQSTAARAPHSH